MPSKAPIFRFRSARTLDAVRVETDQRRGSSSERGYDYAWQQLRKQKLNADPLCECDDCKAGAIRTIAANVVDHIITIDERPELRLEWNNLRSMNKVCHDRHTARTQGFGKGRHRG